MPLEKESDVGNKIDQGLLCQYCINEDGSAKTCQEIFDGGVEFFCSSVPGTDKDLAERVVRKNMNQLPFWQGKDEVCLQGEEATDEEFKNVLEKLHTEIAKGKITQ